MVHLSKEPLQKKYQRDLLVQLSRLVGRSSTRNAAALLDGLLGDAEQVMLAKRLAAIMMFHEGYSAYRAAKSLHMSNTTAIKLEDRYRDGTYADLVKLIGRSKAEREKLWETIEVVLRAGMPPMDNRRWQVVNRLLKE